MRSLLPLEVVRQADEAPVGLRDALLLLRDRLLQEVMDERLAENLIKATKTEEKPRKNHGKTSVSFTKVTKTCPESKTSKPQSP